MEDEDDGMVELKLALGAFTTRAQELEWQHRNFEIKVESQTTRARDEIAKDRQEFSRQLQVVCGSMKRTIEAAIPNQKCLSSQFVGKAALAPRNSLSDICRDLTTHFDRLADLSANANRNLNAIHRDTMETETQLTELTPDLEDLELDLGGLLETVNELLEEVQEKTRELRESREKGERELQMREFRREIYQFKKRHDQKKACWLWAGALVTGGLTVPFALAAGSSKRTNRRMRDLNAEQAATIQADLEEYQEAEGQFREGLEEIQDTSLDVEATKESLDEVTKKNGALTTIVQAQLEHYCNLKERAMMIASQTRALQARVETLTYAAGAQEVRRVMFGLINDMQQNEMKALMDETRIKF